MQIKRLVTLTLIVGAMALSGWARLVFYTEALGWFWLFLPGSILRGGDDYG